MDAVPSPLDSWLDAMTFAAAEPPARRRMVRPLRQRIDLQLVDRAEVASADIDPALYDGAGQAAVNRTRPGQLLNVRV